MIPGPLLRVRDCTGSGAMDLGSCRLGPVRPHQAASYKLQASGDSTANSTRGRVEEPGAASYKLDRYSIKDYIGYYES